MVKAILYNPEKLPWAKIKEEINIIEKEAFGKKAFSNKILADDFQDKESIIVLLKDNQKIIGFTYAQPAGVFPEEKIPNKEKTAWIIDTVIKKEFRGKRLVGSMSGLLEKELKKQGYKYVARNSTVANNYAKNISTIYKNKIIYQKGPFDSK